MNAFSIFTRLSARRYADPREEARMAFQRYRRHIESDGNSHVECMSCGRMIHIRDAKGGYYIEPEESPASEFESDNMWPQCPYCLSSLDGNKEGFRKRLINRMGIDRVLRIERIVKASKGDRDALSKLSKEDKLKALSVHNHSYYEYKRCEFESLDRLYCKERISSL